MKDAVDAVIYHGGAPESKLKVYGQSLAQLAGERDEIVCLSADLTKQCDIDLFQNEHPERFFYVGMAEQNMIGTAAGLARAGEIPFAHSFAVFVTRRCYDQIAMSVAYPNLGVKLVGMMPGISSPGGASHQAIDDIALMRATPNMKILDIGEAGEAEQAVALAANTAGPVYLRVRRGPLPVLFDHAKFHLTFNESYLIRKGADVAFISSGLMTERALQAALLLEKAGVSASILHVPSIKPLDAEGILYAADHSKVLITLDNHNIIGGLGSAVAEVLAEHKQTARMYRIGIPDVYGIAAKNSYLFKKFGFNPDQIAQTALNCLEGKSGSSLTDSWHGTNDSDESGWGTDFAVINK